MSFFTQPLYYIPISLLVTAFTLVYLWAKHASNYWKNRNIPHAQTLPFFGSLKDVILMKKTISMKLVEYHYSEKLKNEPIYGMHFFYKPALVIKDLELIKRIMVKDFNSFSDRHSNADIHSDILGGANLFFIRNPIWRKMRAKLTPFFTSAKLKQMFYIVDSVGEGLDKKLMAAKVDPKTNSFTEEVKDLLSRYTTDVIASCAFGVEANSLQNPKSEFRENGKKIFNFTIKRAIEVSCIFYLPELVNFFKFKLFTAGSTEFLRTTINYVIETREKSGQTRNDLIDTLIELRDNDAKNIIADDDIAFRGDVIVSQASVFFTAGFETSSSAMSFALFELSRNQEIQKRLREEIKEMFSKNNGKLQYDDVQNMQYLRMVLSETLRLYPILPFMDRICTDPNGYSLEPISDFRIPYGTPIVVPVYPIQIDPQYYPNPMKFDPERFAPDKTQTAYTYMPFGTGPHNCIGERFGLLQAKVGLINFLKNHYVTESVKTPGPTIKFDLNALLNQPAGGIYVNIIRDPLIR